MYFKFASALTRDFLGSISISPKLDEFNVKTLHRLVIII
jgi:hypothetical protein